MRPISKNIPMVKSERVLGDLARSDVGIQNVFNLEEEVSDEDPTPLYSDSEADSSDLWPGNEPTKTLKKKIVTNAMSEFQK